MAPRTRPNPTPGEIQVLRSLAATAARLVYWLRAANDYRPDGNQATVLADTVASFKATEALSELLTSPALPHIAQGPGLTYHGRGPASLQHALLLLHAAVQALLGDVAVQGVSGAVIDWSRAPGQPLAPPKAIERLAEATARLSRLVAPHQPLAGSAAAKETERHGRAPQPRPPQITKQAMAIGLLYERREIADWTNKQLAEELKVHEKTIPRWNSFRELRERVRHGRRLPQRGNGSTAGIPTNSAMPMPPRCARRSGWKHRKSRLGTPRPM
jgi:hypothetical protein